MWLLSLAIAMFGAPAVLESGEAQTTLVELYTSEGCSSCPPAEAQFARLRDDPRLWKEIVPVAFHVDYWDNLGWPDRFASASFAQRQKDYAALWRAGTIYTPQFVRNGHDVTQKRDASANPGVLRVNVSPDGSVTIAFRPTKQPADRLEANLVPLAGGVVSDVRRGENAGRKLAHEFVALDLLSVPMELEKGVWSAKAALPEKTEAPIAALAVWVHAKGDPTPIQATGGWLKKTDRGL
jgi:hypothetical protein